YCMCSRSSGLISASMKASISASSPGRWSGRANSTAGSPFPRASGWRGRGRSATIQGLLPDGGQRADRVGVADLQSGPAPADEDGGEVLEHQRDRRGDVLRVEVCAVALLLR